jgi:peptidyl-tRNA hydrolase, PTH2 family
MNGFMEKACRQKIILKANNEAKLHQISTEAVSQGIKYPAEIYDARKTQLEPNTFTALGIGPAPYYKIDPLVKDLKYL